MNKHEKFELGRSYWIQYTNINGYSFEPTVKGLQKLAKNLDLDIKHIKEYINFYLEA